ncbi:MAG TPA: universal stress protein [Candidatus Lokiarchaeia archaeon]|nr:universal stress protein [Candidatus Lokiarchaeia archaeon]
MFSKILVAFDGSDHASVALDKAIELGKQGNASIVIFYAVQHFFRTARTFPIPFLSMSVNAYDLDEQSEQAVYNSHKSLGERLLVEAKQKVEDAGLSCETELVESTGPVEAAKDLVRDKGIDLVIVGAGGVHNALGRAVLGSVSTGIANNVCCNIMIIRAECST